MVAKKLSENGPNCTTILTASVVARGRGSGARGGGGWQRSMGESFGVIDMFYRENLVVVTRLYTLVK